MTNFILWLSNNSQMINTNGYNLYPVRFSAWCHTIKKIEMMDFINSFSFIIKCCLFSVLHWECEYH
jgi:hypothetical protein